MNKIYITDLDHTFLRSDLSVSAFSTEIWNQKAKESTLSIATARSFYSAQALLPKLHINAPMILLDGSLVVTPEKKILDAKFVAQDAANALIEESIKFCDLHPFTIGLKDDDLNESFDYPSIQSEIQKKVLTNYKYDPRLLEHSQVVATDKIFKIVYMDTEARLRPLTLHLQQIFGDTFEFKLSPENYTGGYFLTILHPLGDKAHALKSVMEYLDQPLEKLHVFGDSINDIAMFKMAGHALAVQNALTEVKVVADTVLQKSNDEDAVAHYLQSTMR